MKVRELIAELIKLDQDMPVIIEGCDCANPARAVERDEGWTDFDGTVEPPHAYIRADLS